MMTESMGALDVEALFDSVEIALVGRHQVGEVPSSFQTRLVDHLRKIVNAWWQIYQESAAAVSGKNRTIWERDPTRATAFLDRVQLVEALIRIRQLTNLEALQSFRPVHQAEYSAVGILDLLTAFYGNNEKQTNM